MKPEDEFKMTTTLLICGHWVTVTAKGLFIIDGKSAYDSSNKDKTPFGCITFSAANATKEQVKLIHKSSMRHYTNGFTASDYLKSDSEDLDFDLKDDFHTPLDMHKKIIDHSQNANHVTIHGTLNKQDSTIKAMSGFRPITTKEEMNMEICLRKCKVGDWIWTIQCGWEKVVHIEDDNDYPVKIIGGGSITLNGLRNINDKHPSAFLTNPFDPEDQPPCEFIKGQVIAVWDTPAYEGNKFRTFDRYVSENVDGRHYVTSGDYHWKHARTLNAAERGE